MTRIIDTQKARRRTPVSISNKNTYMETGENRTTVDEAIDWLSTLPLTCKDGAKAKLITDMAIEALKDRAQGKWLKAVDDGVWSFTDAYAECDQCHKVTFNGWNMNYCPQCGANMRGDEE